MFECDEMASLSRSGERNFRERSSRVTRKKLVRESQHAMRTQLELEKTVAFALIDVQELTKKVLGDPSSIEYAKDTLGDLFDSVNKYTEKPEL